MRSLGTFIPPELFEYVLQVLKLPDDIFPTTRDYVAAEKRQIGNCALVCKYWADLCQRKIFETIILRSREDMRHLFDLLQSRERPNTPIGSYIRLLKLCPDTHPSDPWMHSLTSSRTHNLHRGFRPKIVVDIRGPLPVRQKSLRTIHWNLPRQLPGFSTAISQLILQDLHFASFEHLVHLVSELHYLRDLSCTAITWTKEMTLHSTPPKGLTKRMRSTRVSMTGSTVDLCAVWLAIALGPGRLVIAREDWLALVSSVAFLQSGLGELTSRRTVQAELSSFGDGQSCVLRVSYNCPAGNDIRCTPGVYYSLSRSSPIPPKTTRTDDMSHIRTIAVDLDNTGTLFDEALKCDWATFEEHVSLLTGLNTVVFGFKTSQEMAQFFADVAEKALKSLACDGRVKYAVSHSGRLGDKWYHAYPNSKFVQGAGSRLLWEL